MAVNLNPAFKYRADPVLGGADRFRRRKPQSRTHRNSSRVRVGPRHILLCFAALAGFFFCLQQSWLFLISWEGLRIDHVTIRCRRPDVQAAAENMLKARPLGNLLLFDIGLLRRDLESHRWIREVRVRRVFPESLSIDIRERVPAAVLQASASILIDREGVLLDPAGSEDRAGLPLFIDAGRFQKDREGKLALAWACLDDLTPSQKNLIAELDLTEYRNVTAGLKGSNLRIKLGEGDFSEKLKTYMKDRARLESYGPLLYIDLRFSDRIYLGLKHGSGAGIVAAGKEAP